MPEVQFYREEKLPFEMKVCDTISDLSYKKHSHEEYSLGLWMWVKALFGVKVNSMTSVKKRWCSFPTA